MDYSPRPFVSVLERFPFWLLGLKPSMVSTLYFSEIRNAAALRLSATINGATIELITKAMTYLGLSKVRFNSSPACFRFAIFSFGSDRNQGPSPC
jgi:hypothetical protein